MTDQDDIRHALRGLRRDLIAVVLASLALVTTTALFLLAVYL